MNDIITLILLYAIGGYFILGLLTWIVIAIVEHDEDNIDAPITAGPVLIILVLTWPWQIKDRLCEYFQIGRYK